MYNENKEDMNVHIYVKRNGRVYLMQKHGVLKDVTEEYNNRVEIKENDYEKEENKLL